MANPLTGDFDAVLQVSGGTVNRLLASMHQNDGENPNVPTFPHSIVVYLGQPEVIDGVRGRLEAQVSVPQIELVDRADDRFVLDVSIRARYTPEPDSEPLADLINGTVRAEYLLTDIDPSCIGWAGKGSNYLWFRVVEDSVSFQGDVQNEYDPMKVDLPLDVPATIEKVTRQLRNLLSTAYAPMPHQVSGRFSRGSMMSLAKGPGNTAVAIPLFPSGPQIGSVDQVVLGGQDFGVAVSAGFILGQVQPQLDQLRQSFGETIHFHSETSVLGITVLTVDIWYSVSLTSATAEWTGGTFFGVSGGAVTVRISGQAVTEKSEYNLTFDITQTVVVTFDAAAQGLALAAAGAPAVDVHYDGPLSGDVIGAATPQIQQAAAAQVQGVLNQVAGRFDLSSQKAELVGQLRTIDDNADAHFEDASFSPDGVVLLGRIVLSPRRPPMGFFNKAPEGNAFTAWDAWIPGGRIDAFAWAWKWAFDSVGPPPGSEVQQITYRLTRPVTMPSRFGKPMATTQLPGLDGMGTLYLNLVGSQVDPLSGELADPVRSTSMKIFTYGINHVPGSLNDPTEPPSGIHDHPHWASLLLGGDERFQDPGPNTLVVHVGDRLTQETSAVLRDGLRACQRRDAGLVVIVLFDNGRLETAVSEAPDDLRALIADLDAPTIVNEDVNGEWSRALGVPERIEQPTWRLLGSTGGVTWMSDDAMTAEALGAALDDHLFPSPPPIAHPYRPVDPSMVARTMVPFTDPNCPPQPLIGRGAAGRALVFAMAGSTGSDARVAELTAKRDDDTAAIVVVVRGASGDEARAFAGRFGKGVIAVPDPDGSITAAAGVRYMPTSLSIDELGIVTSVDLGLDDNPVRDGQTT